MNEELHYKIKASKYIFYLTIRISKIINNFNYTMFVGSKDLQKCVVINITEINDDERYNEVFKPNIANIDFLNESLDRNRKTQLMLQLSMYFTKHSFRHINTFRLNETTTLNLTHYELALYGKSWYESCFSAKKENPLEHTIYREIVDKFSETGKPDKDFIFKYFIKNKDENCIRIFEKSKTYNEFFRKLKKFYGKDFYQKVDDWLYPMVTFIMKDIRFDKYWIITDIPTKKEIQLKSYKEINYRPNYPEPKKGGHNGFTMEDVDLDTE
jgi:hypothetical protein